MQLGDQLGRPGRLLEDHLVQAGHVDVVGHRRLHEHPHPALEVGGQVGVGEALQDDRLPLPDVGPGQLDEDGVLVGEVLIDGPHRDPGRFGDAVRGPLDVAVGRENLSSGVQDPGPGLGRSLLFG